MSETLGKYHIQSELGKGGFATVYRAVDTTLDREVALKVLDPLLLRDGAWVARFRQEARSAANLRHSHIVGIHEIGEVEGRLYIAMELARGGSLAEAIAARGRIPWAETLSLLEPICDALDYAHGQGVVHRDLKPANILLDPEGGPLLTDFGFARLLSDNSMSVSLSGGILGTPAYIAPEIWELDRAERPADIYALGCIVYEMLVGEALFSGKTPMQSMRAHDKGPQYPAAWPEDVPGGIATVLAKALAREPEKRYATARTLWHALRDLEAQAEDARIAAERAAVAAQWRAEAETALAAGELSAAKMAVGRWLSATPEDVRAKAMQAEIAQRMAEAERPAAPQIHLQQQHAQLQPASQQTPKKSQQVLSEPQDALAQQMAPKPPEVSFTTQTSPSSPTLPVRKKRRVPIWIVIIAVLSAIVVCLGIGVNTFLRSLRGPTVQPQRAPTVTTVSMQATTARPVDVLEKQRQWSGSHLYVYTDDREDPNRRQGYPKYEYESIYKNVVGEPAAESIRVSDLGGSRDPVWSPSGEQIAYIRYQNIAITDKDGESTQILESGAVGGNGLSWSPDERMVAFLKANEGVVIQDISSGSVYHLFHRKGEAISWSPDGKKIAFWVREGKDQNDDDGWVIYIVDADGTNLIRVTETNDRRGDFGPLLWSSDSNFLTYISFGIDEWGNRLPYEPWIVAADGTDPQPLNETIEVINQRYYPWLRYRSPEDFWW